LKSIIYYFSATGNCLTVARDIAKILGDTELVNIADVRSEKRIDLPYERVGFVYPSYYVSAPPVIIKFVDKLNFEQAQYVFAVVTAGGAWGQSFLSFSKKMAICGGHLDACFKIQMPGNNITLYSAWSPKRQKKLNRNAKKKTALIAEQIKAKAETRLIKGCPLFRLRKNSFIERIDDFGQFAKDFRVSDKCTGCGTCARVCPKHNIVLKGSCPKFGGSCERCTACIQWCPVKAIDYKDVTQTRKQYRHPDVKASDIFTK
jgi:ferredoxin/flavodoxin